jgi:hypothetical protein
VTLADRLALALVEHGPESGSRLARHVHVRKRDVLAELRTSPRFVQVGRGRNATWRPEGWDPRGTGQEPQRTRSEPRPGKAAGAGERERLEALERRVARLERQLAATGTAEANGGNGAVIDGQMTVEQVLAEAPAT